MVVVYHCIKEKIGQECQKDGEIVYILTKGQVLSSVVDQQITQVLTDACIDMNSIKDASGEFTYDMLKCY